MSIRKYIAYLRTVETGSITQAANELGYTQSAVSKMISDLEQDWQVKLLTRNHSGIEISSDGMVLLPTIREIVMRTSTLPCPSCMACSPARCASGALQALPSACCRKF